MFASSNLEWSQTGGVSLAQLIAAVLHSAPCWPPFYLDFALASSSVDFLHFGCLGSATLCLLPLQLHLESPLGFRGIWMSQEDLDSEDIELNLQLAGLSISVRGSPASAASFVRDLASPAPSTARHSFESVAPASPATQPDPVRSTLFSSPARPTSSPSPSSETRASIAASFPPCPGHLLDSLAPRLRGPTTGEHRIRRAWLAGCWAKAVGEGRIGTPNRSDAIPQANRFYCVLFSQRVAGPRIYDSSRSFFAAVGRIEGSDTICHGFPSEAECRAYFEGAGVVYPLSFN